MRSGPPSGELSSIITVELDALKRVELARREEHAQEQIAKEAVELVQFSRTVGSVTTAGTATSTISFQGSTPATGFQGEGTPRYFTGAPSSSSSAFNQQGTQKGASSTRGQEGLKGY